MGHLNLNFVFCSLLLSTMAVGQYVVTVSVGTCLPSLGSMSFINSGGPEPSGLPAGSGVMPNKPCVISPLCWQWVHLIWSREPDASAAAPSTPSSTSVGFLISYQAPGNSPLLRRDVESFPTLDGHSTSACIHSPLFNLDSAGQLSVVNAGTSMTYSSSPGVISALFAPSGNVGNISTTWQLTAGTLSWQNSLFVNGTASLCSDPTGAIQAYFLAPIPANCTAISLTQASGQNISHSDNEQHS